MCLRNAVQPWSPWSVFKEKKPWLWKSWWWYWWWFDFCFAAGEWRASSCASLFKLKITIFYCKLIIILGLFCDDVEDEPVHSLKSCISATLSWTIFFPWVLGNRWRRLFSGSASAERRLVAVNRVVASASGKILCMRGCAGRLVICMMMCFFDDDFEGYNFRLTGPSWLFLPL